jgi:hypothetical protein
MFFLKADEIEENNATTIQSAPSVEIGAVDVRQAGLRSFLLVYAVMTADRCSVSGCSRTSQNSRSRRKKKKKKKGGGMVAEIMGGQSSSSSSYGTVAFCILVLFHLVMTAVFMVSGIVYFVQGNKYSHEMVSLRAVCSISTMLVDIGEYSYDLLIHDIAWRWKRAYTPPGPFVNLEEVLSLILS